MYAPTKREQQLLNTIGECLKRLRIANNQYQAEFAARLGISVPTYRKMEQGNAAVPIGYWIRALDLLDQRDEVHRLLPALKCSAVSEGKLYGLTERQRARRAK